MARDSMPAAGRLIKQLSEFSSEIHGSSFAQLGIRVRSFATEMLPDSCIQVYFVDESKCRLHRLFAINDNHFAKPAPDYAAVCNLPRSSSFETLAPKNSKLFCTASEEVLALHSRIGSRSQLLVVTCLPARCKPEIAPLLTTYAQLAIGTARAIQLSSDSKLQQRLTKLSYDTNVREDFLRLVCTEVQSSFDAFGCSIFLRDHRHRKLYLAATTGLVNPDSGEVIDSVEYKDGEGFTGRMASSGKVVRLLNAEDPIEKRQCGIVLGAKSAEVDLARVTGTVSFMAGPIYNGSREKRNLEGAIRVLRKVGRLPFLPTDEARLRMTTAILGAAIDKWRVDEDKARHLRRMSSLVGIIEVLHGTDESNPHAVFDRIVSEARALFDAYAASVLLLEDDSFRVAMDSGDHAKLADEVVFPRDRGLCGQAATKSETIVVPDVRRNSHYHKVHNEVRSEICSPIIYDGTCLGVLNLDSTVLGHFRPDDQDTIALVETFAKQAAIAIHRCTADMEREKLRDKAMQFAAIATAENLATALAHELKNGLLGVSCAVNDLCEDSTDPDVVEILSDVKARTDEMLRLATRIGDTSRPDPLDIKPAILNQVVIDRVELLKPILKIKNMGVSFVLDRKLDEAGLMVLLDEKRIGQVIANLMLNAIDASSQKQKIEVETKLLGNGFAALSVRDFGTGISPEVKSDMFELFFTTKKHGTGIGLPVVRQIADQHGGKVELTTKLGRGTTFTVLLKVKT